MDFFLSIFWFIRGIKEILFWVYLWQLKEYHIGRFLAHFQTEKGKRLIFSTVNIIKILFFTSFFIEPIFLPVLLLILYILESFKAMKDSFQKRIKKPVFTFKTVFLIFVGVISQIGFLFLLSQKLPEITQFSFGILLFDLLTPLIASIIVLVFQPIAAIARWQIIQKAKEKRKKYKNLLVVGITGSYGKTSTKEFLAKILSEKFRVLKTKEHQNSEVGISRCILNDLNENHEVFVVEMGAYNKGGIKLLCDIARPEIGIVTGVNEQHLATFGSMENLLSAEGGQELIDSLPSDGVAFLNAKNKYCLELYQKTLHQNKFGAGQAKIKKILYGQEARFAGEENILGAMMIAKTLGMTDEEISRGAEKIKGKFPGIEIKKGKNELNIIDATYSANPTGVMAHLEYLKIFPGKKIIVTPCLIELGKAAKEVHKRIGEIIGNVCDLAIITTKDYFKELKEGAIKSGMSERNIIFLEDPQKILKKLSNFTKENSVILLESRVPKEVVRWLSD
jgi:UDP-N-acetylmuramoyl-tripeptide--D-alanyl-D-alanine ligase